MYILLYIKLITNKKLLYITGNYSKFCNGPYGKRTFIKSEYVCVCVCVCIHFSEHLPLTQHCKSTILQLKKNKIKIALISPCHSYIHRKVNVFLYFRGFNRFLGREFFCDLYKEMEEKTEYIIFFGPNYSPPQ